MPWHVVFDVIIAVIIASVPLYLLQLRRRWSGLPARGRHVLAAALLFGFWAVVFYGSLIEPRLLLVRHYPLRLGQGDRTLSIAFVADLHLGLYKGKVWTEKVVRKINAERPDVVILGGDIATNMSGLDALKPLQQLDARRGVFAVLGNYDYQSGAVDVRRRVESYGVEVLTNESVAIGEEGAPVSLIGLDDFWFGRPDWNSALSAVPEAALRIAAVHNPDLAPAAEANGIDLTVAGHTHGGQIRLPFIGPLTRLPIAVGQNFDRGLFDFGPMRLFITPGVGESGPRARLLAPPEISVIDVVY